MRQPPRRKFNLGDALIMTGALAIMLALARYQPYDSTSFLAAGRSRAMQLRVVENFVGLLTPFVATLTLAVLAIRLRRPRPDLPRLIRQPGASAGLAAALVMAIDLGMIFATFLDLALGGYRNPSQQFIRLVIRGEFAYVFPIGNYPGHPDAVPVGLAVAAVWFVQALGRRRRPEPHWIDRSGRALGWTWIALMLAGWLAR